MSAYYNIKGLKIRISDHEPNERLRGSSDIELYVKSADNRLLSIENQIEYICEKRGYDESDFQEIINDWKDGSYGINVFSKKEDEIEENENKSDLYAIKLSLNNIKNEQLKGYSLSRSAKHAEIKELSKITGVSQSYIKKYFGIR